jgi:hypothetical protein
MWSDDNQFDTCDIIVMTPRKTGMFSAVVKFMTPGQPFSHVAMIVAKRDWSSWDETKPIPPIQDYYILESSNDKTDVDNYTGEFKFGPKLTKLYDRLFNYDPSPIILKKLRFAGDHDPVYYAKMQHQFTLRINEFIENTIDRTYERDAFQMFKSVLGGHNNQSDPSSYFCTEYTADSLKATGVLPINYKLSNNYILNDFVQLKNSGSCLNYPFYYNDPISIEHLFSYNRK